MSQISNVSKINFSTAFETDKTCAILIGSYAANSYDDILGGILYRKKISHQFTRPVLCDGIFSSDGSTYVPNGQNSPTVTSNVYSDSSFIYMLSTHNTGTIYYKIVCTWIDNYDNTNPLITPVIQVPAGPHPLVTFDSRQNYQKLLINQPYTLNNPGAGFTGTKPIAHNLGYDPNYRLYFESLPNQIWPAISGGVQDIWLYDAAHQFEISGVIDSTNLNLTFNGGISSASTFRAFVKIYYDS